MQVKLKPALHASWIDSRAKDIVRRLQDKGHTTYLVGGCVRDLLVGIHPKDFDIATSALPNEVKKAIYGSYIIGRRFRLVLVKRGEDQFEVATFRRASRPDDFLVGEETPLGDNFFGTPEEDALRRDFTINALFYDPIQEELIDYANAMKDIESRTVRMIGDPSERIKEDPIRALRAIRFAHKLRFRLDPALREAIAAHADLVGKAVLPRRREEYLKFLRLPEPSRAFLEMYDLGLIHTCMPSLLPIFEHPERLDLMVSYLDRIEELSLNRENPIEIYAPLVMAFDIATAELEGLEERRELFFRDEAGLFKAEASDLLHAFDLRHKLGSIEHFQKRGLRRQEAFLSQPGLSFALRVAAFEKELSATTLAFWQNRMRPLGSPSSSNEEE